MFDISFTEILIIAVVAIIVVGPQKLPKTVRTIAHLMGRAQRYVNDIKTDIKREMELEELQKVQQSIQNVGKDIEQSVRSTISDAEKSVQSVGESLRSVESELKDIANEKITETESKSEEPQTPETESTQQETAGEETETASSAPEEAEALKNDLSKETLQAETPPADYKVPSFLSGEVELSIPEAPAAENNPPETDQKT